MYKLTLTESESDALSWIAARYSSAAVLDDAEYLISDPEESGIWEYEYPEHVIWKFQTACEQEDGGFVPCAGGSLATKLSELLNSIV